MGREVKRVALDFEHPLGEVWPGFLNPHYKHCHKCPDCAGSGYTPEAKKLNDDWYGFNDPKDRWSDKLTQDEVDALVEAGRLRDFTHLFVERGAEDQEDRIIKTVPADVVNRYSEDHELRHSIGWVFGHDAINQWICLEKRAERLGIEVSCLTCGGNGEAWESEEHKQAAEDWKPEEPPAGEGWQVWETVSEGSPVSPVYATKEELADWLGESTFFNNNSTREQWLAFLDVGWAPSLVATPEHGVQTGVEAASNIR